MLLTRLLLLLFTLFTTTTAPGADRWYVFSMADTPVGYAVEESAGGRTRNEVFARLTRPGKSLEMRFETISVESDAGELQSLTFEAVLSKQPTKFEARVEGDVIRILTPPHERTIARGDAPILGPRAIARRSAAKLRAPGDSFGYAIFSPELQRVAKVTRTVVALENAPCDGSKTTRVDE